MSVRQAQREIDSAEYAEWAAYQTTEPFAYERSENVLSIIACLVANLTRKKGSKAFAPSDFKPKYGKRVRDSAKQMEIKLRAMFGGNNK